MERMIDPHEPREDALRLQLGEHRLERKARAGKRERTRAVERRDGDRAVVARDQGARFFFAESPTASIVPSPRAHSSMKRARSTMMRAPSSRLNTPATHAAAISPTLWPTTADGLDAPRFPKLRERHLHRENRRLRDFRPVHLRGLLVAAEFFEEGETAPTAASRRRSAPSSRGRPARGASVRGPCPTIADPGRS